MISLSNKTQLTPEEKKMLRKAYKYSLGTNMAGDKVTMQGKCFAMTMSAGAELFYKDNPEKQKEVFARHDSEFFNTHQVFVGLLAGIALAMEKLNSKDENLNMESAITSTKASLMGPTAGIGDSFFFNCFRVIIAGVAIGLGANGSILGPLFFFVLYGGILLLLRYYALVQGYMQGTKIISAAYEKGIIPLITESASVLGAMMVGALIAGNVSFSLSLAPVINGATVDFQKILDTVMPGILPLGIFFACFSRFQKGWGPVKMIFTIMIACILLALIRVI